MSEDVGSFGERVREARDASGMSQRAFAELVGIDRMALARLETGDRDPRLSEAIAVASALGIPIGRPAHTGFSRYTTWMNKIEKSLLEARESARSAFVEAVMLSEQFGDELADEARSNGAVGETMDDIFFGDLRRMSRHLRDPKFSSTFVQQEIEGDYEVELSRIVIEAVIEDLFRVYEE